MMDWKKVVIAPSATIRETIEVIDTSTLQIALVLDREKRLLGTITDGDIRRAILKGLSLDDSASTIMNSHPVTVSASESRDKILALMQSKTIHQLPVIGEDGILVGLEILDNLLLPSCRNNPVVLMAGGLGSRLRPLTNECPKPLLTVGSKPILETILENFVEYGFRKFYLSVNYKAEMVQQHFGDGSRWGVDISYLKETERMGTAGALSLLPSGITEPILVMNGDLLTKVNFSHLLGFHSEHQAKATLCVRDYEFQVPYGVVKVDRHRLIAIEEKPVHQFFVSAGIYVLEPDVLQMIPENTYYDMPSLLEKLLEKQFETAVFPIREYWLDIGRMADFERANCEYDGVFA